MPVAQARHLLVGDLTHEVSRHRRALGEACGMPAPLPYLRARYLGGGHVLHQVVDSRGADTAHPRLDVLDADADVEPEPSFRDRASRDANVDQLRGGGVNIGSLAFQLVGAIAEHAIKRLGCGGHQVGMRYPGAIEPIPHLAVFVLFHLRQRDAIDLGIATRRYERGHPTHRVRATFVACLHQQLRVRAHEGDGHRHLRAVGKHEIWTVSELLDDAEDVVPASRVETARVIAQLVEDLFHLERSEDRFDEYSGADRSPRNADGILREIENVVPKPRLEVALELGEIEVRSTPFAEKALGVVKEVEAEIEEAAGDRLTSEDNVSFV